MQYSRQHVVDVLRAAGLGEAADDAQRELPDPVDVGYVEEWGIRRGITKDLLISQMGGSP